MFSPMPLPFARDAIMPLLSQETFDYHYDRHFIAYLNKTNELVGDQDSSLEDIIRIAHEADNNALFQSAGQTWNHAFFWMTLSPEAGAVPSAMLAEAIVRDFGSHNKFCDAFVTAGSSQFGSGWCWLVTDAAGTLSLTTTHDAMPAWVEQDVTPLLVCDVWEHAYYIDWRNDRSGFLTAFIHERANWAFASQQFDAVVSGEDKWSYPQ